MLVGIRVLDISDNGPVLLNLPANSSIEWGESGSWKAGPHPLPACPVVLENRPTSGP